MKKMHLLPKGVIVHTPHLPRFPLCRLNFWLQLVLFALFVPFIFSAEAAAAAKETPEAARKTTAKTTADTAKSTVKSTAKTAPRKPAAKETVKSAKKTASSSKTAKGKSRKRLYVRSMLPEGEKASLRERGISSGYGPRAASSRGKAVRLHKGIDVSAPLGSPVLAFNDGEIIFAGRDGGYGISLIVQQADGRRARYAHMQKLLASQGEAVVRGQKIGLVGRTGRTTGPHLHFELIEDDQPVDPAMHVWDSTELVLLPGDLDIHEMRDDEHLATASARSDHADTQ